jgi:hypothetical protein
MGLAGLLAVWQIHIASNVPTLVVRGLIATLYQKGVAAGSFVLSDLSIVEGNLTIGFALGFAFFALALMSTALGALGQSRDLETSLSLSLLPRSASSCGCRGFGSPALQSRSPTLIFRAANYSSASLPAAPGQSISTAGGRGMNYSFFFVLASWKR